MNLSLRAAKRLAASACIASVVGLVVPVSSAWAANQTFKCIVGGRTVYQQQACPANADLPTPPGTAASAPVKVATAASAPAGPSRRLKPASRPASAAPATRR